MNIRIARVKRKKRRKATLVARFYYTVVKSGENKFPS